MKHAVCTAVLVCGACASSRPTAPRGEAPPSPTSHAPPATVRHAMRADDLVGGPNASGRHGDIVLENAHVRAVIEQLPGGGGFALTGGSLLDLAARDGDTWTADELGQVFTMIGEFPRQLSFHAVREEVGRDGVARVVVSGDDVRTPGLRGETEYALGPDDRALTLRTTLRYEGESPTTVLLADALEWGGGEHWAPGYGYTLPRRGGYPWVGAVGLRVAYAYAGEHPLEGPNGSMWSNPSQRSVMLSRGESVTYTRRIAAASGADLAAAVAKVTDAHPAGTVRLRAHEGDHPVAGAQVTLLRVGAGDPTPMALGATDAAGALTLHVDAGTYRLDVRAAGRSLTTATGDVAVGDDAAIDLPLSRESGLDLTVTVDGAAGPSRVMFRGLDDTPTPLLGPNGHADGARNSRVLDATGRCAVPLAPGRYEVTATHGPEYALAVGEVTIAEGARAQLTLAIARAVDTRGYVCGDFHQHQAPSLDAPLSLRERVRADAAEGLEVVASTDHNVATDLSHAVDEESLRPALLTLPGVEVSTDIARAPIGHLNVFPLVVDPTQARGGLPDLLELDQPAFVHAVRTFAPDAVIQVNHPRSPGPTGLFRLVGLDARTGAAQGPFDPHFDAVEIWNGRWQTSVDEGVADWFSLLRNGASITAMGNSDSHAVVTQEAGYPRTCVAVPDDTPGRFTAADVVRALRESHDAVVTDGPFVRVRDAQGASALGRHVRAPAVLTVSVEAPSWAAPDALEMIDMQGARRPVAVRWVRAGATVRATARVPVTVSLARASRFVVFRATGSRPLPVLVGDPPVTPMAITNPVWLDAP